MKTDPALTKPARKLIGIPAPTHKLIQHVAAHRGLRVTDAIYIIAREALERDQAGTGWSFVPPPWSIRPTYLEDKCAVLVFNPFLPSLILTGPEAYRLADVLHGYADMTPAPAPSFVMTTDINGNRISLSRGGAYITITVDDASYSAVPLMVRDIATAIENAAVHAGPYKATPELRAA